MSFIAYDVTKELLVTLRPVVPAIAAHNKDLADQLYRAASSVLLNLAEGQKFQNGNRSKHYAIAHGSANEVKAALDVAEAWGWIESVGPSARCSIACSHYCGSSHGRRRSAVRLRGTATHAPELQLHRGSAEWQRAHANCGPQRRVPRNRMSGPPASALLQPAASRSRGTAYRAAENADPRAYGLRLHTCALVHVGRESWFRGTTGPLKTRGHDTVMTAAVGDSDPAAAPAPVAVPAPATSSSDRRRAASFQR